MDRLQLDGIITCPVCDEDFDHVFTAQEGVHNREELIDAPTAKVKCPNCDHEFEATWGGWVAHEDAG